MSESKPSGHRPVTLHIWPAHEDLLSFDVASVAVLLYLQLAIPGQFSLAYCANPDSSPTGQLPYLKHGLNHVSGLASSIAYIRNHPHAHHVDGELTAVQHAQLMARVAHVESAYGDLVSHTLYSPQENWAKVTRPALVSMLPVPQRYFVPSRIRASYKARLEAAGLWHVPEDDDEVEEPRKVFGRKKKHRSVTEPHRVKTNLEREKVAEKARSIFDVYSTMLTEHQYFLGSATPTTLDVVFAAHTYIVLNLQFPDTLVTSVLQESYPALVSHCRAVISAAFPSFDDFPPTVHSHRLSSLKYMIPWPRPSARKRASSVAGQVSENRTEEWQFKLWRWGFIGMSVLAAATYLHFAPKVIMIRNPFPSGQPTQASSVADTAETDEDQEDDEED